MNTKLQTIAGRIAPHSNDAEVSVLGSILLNNDVLDEAHVSDLTPGMFYREAHSKLFATILRLRAESQPIDLVTLSAALSAAGLTEAVGGLTYLVGLSDQVPTSAYAEHYARIVHEQWQLREVIVASGKVMADAYDQQKPLEDILADLSNIGANLDPQSAQGTYSARAQQVQYNYNSKVIICALLT